MEDIAKRLWNAIKGDLDKALSSDKLLKILSEKINSGAANYKDALEIAVRSGEITSEILQKYLTIDEFLYGMTYAEAQSTFRPALETGYEYISSKVERVQEQLNKKSNIGLKAIKPELNQDRINGLCKKLSSDLYFDNVKWVLDEPVKNFLLNVVDESVKENAEFDYQCGMKPKIKRIAAANCCEWCNNLAGEYTYPTKGKQIYRRHNYCRCLVIYDPGDGKIQDVHSKKNYTSERAAVEARLKEVEKNNTSKPQYQFRKAVIDKNSKGIVDILSENPQLFKKYTPKSLKELFEATGFDVTTLSSGSQKDKPFEKGGGWKTNFDSERLLMYHPNEGSHHNGEYFKISSGERGTIRYDRDGNIIE